MNIPQDETGNAIHEIISNGVDINRPMDIDFFIDIPSDEQSSFMIKEIQKEGFLTKLVHDSEYNSWTCYCTKNILLDYETILNIEHLLNNIALKYGASIDGFGTYGNI